MVRAAVTVLLVLAAHSGAAQLLARLDVRESRLGEPVVLHVEAHGRNVSLDEAELPDLSADFEVFSITRSSDANRSQLEATLYPLHTGVLQVPAIAAAGARSAALTLRVTEDPDLTLDAKFVPDRMFERQASVLLIAIRDKADRQWSPPAQLQAPGLLLRPLGERQYEEGTGPQHVNVRELRWEVLGLKGDHYALKLPMLDAYQLGRRLRVPLPVAPLEVRALPAYLPVTVPVGKPALSVEPLPTRARVGMAQLWVLRIASPGFTPDAARALLRLPEGGHDGVRFYPASFHQESSKQGAPALRIEIPIVFTRAGTVRLPALSLPYFDPVTQRMEALPLAAARIEVSDPFWRRVAGVAGVVLLLLITGFGLYWGRALWERRQARRAALRRVAQATTTGALVQSVRAYALAPHPHTLRQWLARRPNRPDLQSLVEDLERVHFGAASNTDLAAVKQRWLAALGGQRLT